MMRQNHYFSRARGEPSPQSGRISRRRRQHGSVALPVIAGTLGILALCLCLPFLGDDDAAKTGLPVPPVGGGAPRHDVTILADSSEPVVYTGTVDASGQPVAIGCGTCHATKPPALATRSTADLDLFHQGLAFAHGELSCLSCHDSTNYERLRLASGEGVSFADRQLLCVQCHGPTARDYEHGAHGGMTGHWDLTHGPRTRLGCTQCHDPHAPAYPKMARTFFTHDRGVEVSDEH
jgi:Doubled CXXCH motif (Paired_CXXCH_1)